MANSIIMPKTGMAMEEGVIIEWRIKEGDKVSKGDVVALIETDKSTMELESDYDGVILAILGKAGETVPVTRVIAWVGQAGEAVPAGTGNAMPGNAPVIPGNSAAVPGSSAAMSGNAPAVSGSFPAMSGNAPAVSGSFAVMSGNAPAVSGSFPAMSGNPPAVSGSFSAMSGNSAAMPGNSGAASPVRATPAARALAKERGLDLASAVPGGKYCEIRRADVEAAARAGGKSAVSATPLARRMAGAEGISLEGVQGSGHGGKIFSADLAAVNAAQTPPAGTPQDRRVPLTNIQKITGKRLAESRQTIPEVTAQIRADVTRLLEVRRELNEGLAAAASRGAKSGGKAKFTINDFILAAVVKSLLANPRLNSTLDGNELIYRGGVNLGVAVATGRGLVVPVIHNAQGYSLAGLSERAAELAAKAREGRLGLDEMAGGTFTVSNIGMYGITAFTPIINPPEAAILGVCAVEDELKLEGEKVVNRKKMGLSLAYDHRIVDGAESSIFLRDLKDLLEAPLLILA